VGPHALSVLLPPLGDVADGADAITAARGPGDMVHIVLRHASGASSAITVSHTVPPQASAVAAELRGSAGVSTLPERNEGGPVRPFERAVDALIESARTGEPHACDVRFGLRVTEILATAEKLLGPADR
jgi:predicted dehydrogenase